MGREEERRGGLEEDGGGGGKVRTPPSSIPAYAPAGHSDLRHCCSQNHPSRGYKLTIYPRLCETVSDNYGKSYK